MTWKDILKDNMKRVKDKDRRRNPKKKDEVDIKPKDKKTLPKAKPFNPFGPNAGERATQDKRLRAERKRRKAKDTAMDTKPSRKKQQEDEQLRLARELKERRG